MNRPATYLLAVNIAILMSAVFLPASAQGPATRYGDIVEFDRIVYDFGDILISDGPVRAQFKAKNISSKPMAIYNVVSSCGCTGVEWTREPVAAGKEGIIQATYDNNQGPYSFDKTLTVYISGLRQPIVLRLRGESHSRKLNLAEMYPVRFGDLAFKTVDIKAGNLSQGEQKSGEVSLANLGQKPLKVTFKKVGDGLTLHLPVNPIPAQRTAKLIYTVTADRKRWGRNRYYATPLVNGKAFNAVVSEPADPEGKAPGSETVASDPDPRTGAGRQQIGFLAITRENFSSWSKEERDEGSQPMMDQSTFSFGKVKAGTRVEGSYGIRNQGKSTLKIYKVDSESGRLSAGALPTVEPGARESLNVSFDTSGLPAGESFVILTLYTNSPLRPMINLFLTGWIE